MKVSIINGSPKGEESITIQYFYFIKKRFLNINFRVFEIAKDIKKIQKDSLYFNKIIKDLKQSDAIVWFFPVYYHLVPAQLKIFIEKLFEKNDDIFKNKYSTSISTSIHYFDNTAHDYIHSVSEDLGMNYIEGLSFEMNDLLRRDIQKKIYIYFKKFFNSVKQKIPIIKKYDPINYKIKSFNIPKNMNIKRSKIGKKRVVLILDNEKNIISLRNMVNLFIDSISEKIDIIDLSTLYLKGGCLGCVQCMNSGRCVYNDDMYKTYKERIEPADAIVYASFIRDRFFNSRMKLFFDRWLFNGHCPVLKGKQAGFIISGPLKQIPNIRSVIIGYMENMGANLIDIVTDEESDSNRLTKIICEFTNSLSEAIELKLEKPTTFIGIAGHKIERDFVYKMSYILQNDHRFYKKNRLYDFPSNSPFIRFGKFLLSAIFRLPFIKKAIQKNTKKILLKPLRKVILDNSVL